MIALAAVAGYFLGSLPTANAIARLVGVDLRAGGSGNPGTNNARQLGGMRIAVPILLVELGKGVAAGWLGMTIGGSASGVAAGLAAILGNVVNIWYRGQGGKGLAISAGVLLAIWPFALPLAVIVIVVFVVVTRSTGIASLGALTGLIVMSLMVSGSWPSPWGVDDAGYLQAFAFGMAAIVAPKHIVDTVAHFKRPALP